VAIADIQQHLIRIFETWGLPQWIKVDNGRPFGDPQMELIPPLALWLIGLGVQVIWNRPARPQDNAKVERSQGVMGRWTEFSKCINTNSLAQRLRKEAHFHNYHFPIRRQQARTRKEVFPNLAHTGKTWNPDGFSRDRVLKFLANGYWERKVSSGGQISIYGHRFSVGQPLKHQRVSIKLAAQSNEWHIFNAQGKLIKKRLAPFTVSNLWNLDFSST